MQMDSLLQCFSSLTELPIKALTLLPTTLVHLYSDASQPHPLFSSSTAAGIIVFLYLPHQLLLLLFSPVLLSTLFLLFALFHYGSKPQKPFPCEPSSPQNPVFSEPFSGGGPLEIIYEEYEREEEEEDGGRYSPEYFKMGFCRFERFCYSDSEMESEEEETESLMFQWEEEGEGLIEIPLEEDYMFEIDISACR